MIAAFQKKHNNREKWERWVLSEHDLDLDLWPWYPGRNLDTSFLNVLENMITLRPVTAVFCRVGDRICPKHIEYIRILRILRLSRTDVDSDFCCLCRHLLDFSNGTWPTFDQLHREYGGPPRINLAPPGFWVLGPSPSVYFILVETVLLYSLLAGCIPPAMLPSSTQKTWKRRKWVVVRLCYELWRLDSCSSLA